MTEASPNTAASAPAQYEKTVMNRAGAWGRVWFQTAFGIDLRTLALFRVNLAFLLLADLVNRAQFLEVFYTDRGAFPRAGAIAYNLPTRLSLHFINGEPWFVIALWVVAALASLLLLVGYRTRLMLAVSWVLLMSIQARNPLVLQAGDQLLVLLCFWGLFLPLGQRFSIDAALRPAGHVARPNAYASVATFAILVQAIYVYVIGALIKTSSVWMPEGTAVYYALHLDTLAMPFAYWLRDLRWLLPWLTYFVYWIELLAALLVFSPIFHLPLRLTTIALLIAMHAGFALSLMIGLFPYISIASLLLFIPGKVWDWLDARLNPRDRREIVMYYDKDCGFCRKVCQILRSFCLTPSNAIRPAQDTPEITPLFHEHQSWVVTRPGHRPLIKWPAVAFILRQSWPLKPLGWLLDRSLLVGPGNAVYRAIGDGRSGIIGQLRTRFWQEREPFYRLSMPMAAIVIALTGAVFWQNLTTLKQIDVAMPSALKDVQASLRLTQRWSMFAPRPLRWARWPRITGRFEDGTMINLWTGEVGAPERQKPKYLVRYLRDYRWRKFFNVVSKEGKTRYLHDVARYYCRKYNRYETGPKRLHRIHFDVISERTRANYAPKRKKRERVLNWNCLAKPK
ncbi:MAG: HTTM domain-containing protein [Pseudomonadota bacterium]